MSSRLSKMAAALAALSISISTPSVAEASPSKNNNTLANVASGIWVGYGGCAGMEGAFALQISKDPSSPGAFIAKSGFGLPPINFIGRPESDGQTMILSATDWRTDYPGTQSFSYDLELTYLPQSEMLLTTIIFVEEQMECRNITARKVADKPTPPNSEGLLFKAAPSTSDNQIQATLEVLSEEDCANYANWMSERHKFIENNDIKHPTHPALYDPDGMVDILGRDFLSWTDEDASRFKNIGAACQTKLNSSRNKTALDAVKHLNKVGWSGAPLDQAPDDTTSLLWYSPALQRVYADTISNLLIDKYRLSEGLDGAIGSLVPARYGDRRARLAAAPKNKFLGEWVGAISCGGKVTPQTPERLVRLLVDLNSARPSAEFQLGPYKDVYTGSVGAFQLTVKHDPITNEFYLNNAWSRRKPQQTQAPHTIIGKFSPSTGVITGSAVGFTDIGYGKCTDLSLHKVQHPTAPKNPDGLLFQLVLNDLGGVAAHRLTPQHCTAFFSWQSEYDSVTKPYKLGKRTIYKGLLDSDRMREVFGKDIYQWSASDAARMKVIRQTCRNILLEENNPENIAIMEQVDPSSYYGWAILETAPRDVRKDGKTLVSADWFRVEDMMRMLTAKEK